MTASSPGFIDIPTIDSLRLELERLHLSGVPADAPIRIDMIANAPGAYIIRQVTPDSETINVMTEEGRRRLTEIAADGPVFRVRHACDFDEEVTA